jgi:2-dehydro-3-deoxyphosphogluconate aldolase/(4S)-4-hydroxy-2-oxoglutarate aldolase
MTVFDELGTHGVVPVAVIDDVSLAPPLAEALLKGGLPCVEITFRTLSASHAIDVLVREYPELIVGAGTVMTIDQARAARDAGARFVMSPGFDDEIVDWCVAEGMPVAPGVMTPTEVSRAIRKGLKVLKFFPAEHAGGVATLRALGGVFPEVTHIPTGGIDERNLESYLEESCVVACGGSWLVPRETIRAGDFGEVERRVAGSVEIVRSVRARGG